MEPGWVLDAAAQGLRPLSPQSDSRDLALSSQMQEVLEAKEREVQQLAEGQREVSAGGPEPSL